jgi:hypothetical protein
VALAAVAAVALLVGLGLTVGDQDEQRAALPSGVPSRAAEDRSAAAAALVADLGAALAGGDPAALAALVDPEVPAARRELAAIAANVRKLRLVGLRLRYIADSSPALDAAERAALGERPWLVDVRLTWRVDGVDRRASTLEVPLVLDWVDDRAVFRSARVTQGARSPLWLLDGLTVRRTGGAVVVAADAAGTRQLVAQGARAVATVRARFPRWREPLVVEAPRTPAQFEAASGLAAESARAIAAVTTTADGSGRGDSSSRVILNPRVFGSLGPTGRQVVLSHEATHVALGSAVHAVPMWLSEGIADYVALVDGDQPVRESAAQIRRLVRERGAPRMLPGAAEFDGSDPDVGAWYEAAWLAARLLAREHGEPALLAFYRTAERDRGTDRAFAALGTTEEAFVTRWREELRALAR